MKVLSIVNAGTQQALAGNAAVAITTAPRARTLYLFPSVVAYVRTDGTTATVAAMPIKAGEGTLINVPADVAVSVFSVAAGTINAQEVNLSS